MPHKTNFIDNEIKLWIALFGLPQIVGPHSGENIATCVMKVLRFYDISHKIGTFMMNNVKDNDICVRELVMTFGLNEDQSCLHCIGHIINLIVKAALFGKGISKLEQKLYSTTDKDAFKI